MATNAEIMAGSREHDARVLDEAAKIARRRMKKPAGVSTALFCRTLTDEASDLRAEARELLGGEQ